MQEILLDMYKYRKKIVANDILRKLGILWFGSLKTVVARERCQITVQFAAGRLPRMPFASLAGFGDKIAYESTMASAHLLLIFLTSLIVPVVAFYDPSGPVTLLSPQSFDQKVRNSKHPTIVEFFAPWSCPPQTSRQNRKRLTKV